MHPVADHPGLRRAEQGRGFDFLGARDRRGPADASAVKRRRSSERLAPPSSDDWADVGSRYRSCPRADRSSPS